MSYPEPRHLGGTGEPTATIRRAGHPRELADFHARHDDIWV